MKSKNQWLDEYAESHQNPTNKLIHLVCIPAIAWSSLALVFLIPSPVNLAYILSAYAIFFYFRMSAKDALFAFLFLAPCLISLELVPLPLILPSALIVFAISWVAQFIGHHIEGKKPSFFQDIQFLLIGPLWLMNWSHKPSGR